LNEYIIKITKEAKNDLKLIKNYLIYNLQEVKISKNVMKKIKESIKSLANFPERFPVIKNRYLSIYNLRKCTVNNYIIFYFIEKNSLHHKSCLCEIKLDEKYIKFI